MNSPTPHRSRRPDRSAAAAAAMPRIASLAALAALATAPVAAQQAPEPVRDAVTRFLETQTAGLPGRVELTVTPLDARNQLPPCASLAPFLPGGTRPWGQISVGVRCDSPVEWTAYLQARVAVIGNYLVAARPLPAGQIVGPADIAVREGDLTAQPENTLTDIAQAAGHHTRFAVAAGSPLRAAMLRIPPAVRQGQNVKVLSRGEGFQVSSEGVALNNAAPGEAVRVRMGSGQVVSGTAQPGGGVEIAP